jgi:hypothetical protein
MRSAEVYLHAHQKQIHHKHTAARYQNRSSEPNTYHFKKIINYLSHQSADTNWNYKMWINDKIHSTTPTLIFETNLTSLIMSRLDNVIMSCYSNQSLMKD